VSNRYAVLQAAVYVVYVAEVLDLLGLSCQQHCFAPQSGAVFEVSLHRVDVAVAELVVV